MRENKGRFAAVSNQQSGSFLFEGNVVWLEASGRISHFITISLPRSICKRASDGMSRTRLHSPQSLLPSPTSNTLRVGKLFLLSFRSSIQIFDFDFYPVS